MSSHEITPVRTYVAVFVALIALTGITVAVAEIDLGAMNTVVALAIAATKATLVVIFFMQLRQSPLVTWVAVLSAIFFVLLLLGGTLDDVFTRHTRTYLPYENIQGVVPGVGLEGAPSRARPQP
jgi:cytochrome c oxidase subunit 4